MYKINLCTSLGLQEKILNGVAHGKKKIMTFYLIISTHV